MDIQQMHTTFRTLAQQMGIQLIRGILPESIDVYINTSINEKIRGNLVTGVAITNKDNASGKSSTMSLINEFSTLYKSDRINTRSTAIIESINPKNGFTICKIPITNYMMITNIAIEYDNDSMGNATNCRLINADELEVTLRDYCNGASKQYPIACLNNNKIEIYFNDNNIEIEYLDINYIKNPNVVKFDKDITKCVNCDLPDYTHYEIVELAAQKFYNSVGVIQPNQATQQ